MLYREGIALIMVRWHRTETGSFMMLCWLMKMAAVSQFAFCICFAFANDTVHILGRVIDESDENVPGVRLTLGISLASAITDAQGKFDLSNIPFLAPPPTTKGIAVVLSGAVLTLRGEALRGSLVRIIDLSGCVVAATRCSFAQAVAVIPSPRMANGVYQLYVRSASGAFSARLFFTGNHLQKIMASPAHSSHTVRSVRDSLYCVKLGYLPMAVAVMDADTGLIITLNKKWISCDIHSHTVLSGGSKIPDTVFAHAFSYLDCMANADHGGATSSDTNGNYYQPDSTMPYWRWRSLIEQSWPKILHQRSVYPGKVLLQGFEWNCPSHDHASVGFILDAQQPAAVSNFEYMFDQSDADTGKADTLPKINKTHADAVAAITWLQIQYPRSSYAIINHPSRNLKYGIGDLRDFNNAGPDVAFGFEGMPGHQKKPARGSYDGFSGTDSEAKARTYGGADYMVARIGGLWDALLGEGRRFFVFVNSDFHDNSPYEDFWPGEYGKTWVAALSNTAAKWLTGMRSGAVFVVQGDLINGLDFMIDDGVQAACMGGALSARNDSVSVFIRYKSPVANNHGDTPVVDHIDLIAGEITGKVVPSHPAYFIDTNATARVIKTFAASEFKNDGDWKKASSVVGLDGKNMFFRLRGTNLKPSIEGETDAKGNPLVDALANTEEIAWSDLWFYSNPVFVYKK
jgi:hypothetical protein